MNSTLRLAAAGIVLLLAATLAAHAQGTATGASPGASTGASTGILDEGRLVTFHGDVPVATEKFEYRLQNDSLIVNALTERRWKRGDGAQVQYNKAMTLIAHADDLGLLRYTSNEVANGHLTTRNLEASDTSLTSYTEVDHAGAADVLDRPPGRIFVLDAGLFTLFDVIGRSLQHRIVGSRPVQLVAFGASAMNVEANAKLAGPDTVTWGGRRVVTQRIALRDSSSAFTLWLSPEGHLLRLENEEAGVVVMRDPPALPPPAKRARPRHR